MARPEIRRIDDLKGKRIGITGFGSATDFALLYAEQKWPVKRGRDFTVIQMGGHPEALAALRSRSIDGVVTNPEFTFQARKEGLKELVDMSARQKSGSTATDFGEKNNCVSGRRQEDG